jgi:phosphopantothenoylcysteine decarboxylase
MANKSEADSPWPRRAPAEEVAATIHDGKTHLLLAATGSVATIKLPLIISSLAKHPNLSIRVILTKSAARFIAGSVEGTTVVSLASLPNVNAVYEDEDEWVEPWTRGAEILHIALRRWAHILVIAPLSANTLAKVANGICDNLLTSVIRAWDTTGLIDGKKARILVALAMNTAMWIHPITAQQVRILEEDWGVKEIDKNDAEGENQGTPQQGWFEVLRPIEKTLACGDVGTGAMLEWTEIVKLIEQRLGLSDISSELS